MQHTPACPEAVRWQPHHWTHLLLASNQLEGNIIACKSTKENDQMDTTYDDLGMKKDKRWKKENILKFATWNVQGIAHKEEQLDEILAEKEISVALLSETKKKLQGTKETQNYIQFYSGVKQETRAQAGVMIMLHKRLRNTISDYSYLNERLIKIRLKILTGYLTVIGVYAPTGGPEEETNKFYNNLQHILNKVNKNDYIILLGDFNARIGNAKIDQNIGTFGEQTRNLNGSYLIDFVSYNQLQIMNSFFNHKDSHKFTWEARGLKSIIDYAICNMKLAKLVLDTRVFRGSELETDHHLLITPIRFTPRWYKRKQKPTNSNSSISYKVNLLNDPSIKWLYQKRLDEINSKTPSSEEVEEEWRNITTIIKQAAFESVGTKIKWQRKKGLRKWDENISNVIEDKRKAYKKYLSSGKEEDKIDYHLKRAIAKREVRKFHRRSWNEFVSFLENDVTHPQPHTYKILKLMNNECKDSARLNIIPQDTWLKYYQDLWCQSTSSLTKQFSENLEVENITLDELSSVLTNSKANKAPGEDGINMELFKNLSQSFLSRLCDFMNLIWNGKEPPNAWTKSIVIPIYKKGNRTLCENYRGISLLDSGYKLYSSLLKNKLNIYYENILGEEQMGFRKGRSCCDGYFSLKLLIEKHREFNIETHIGFIDFKKAFDRVDRNILLNILAADNVPQQCLQNIYNIYKKTLISIKTGNKLSNWAQIFTGVRQGCPLSPLLFNIYMNAIIREFKNTRHGFIPINRNLNLDTLVFADDLALFASSEDDLQRSFYNLKLVADKYFMEISTDKTKVMAFWGKDPIPCKIYINEKCLERVNEFKYLGVNLSFMTESDISHKILKYNKSMGIINKIMKPSLVQRHTRTRLYQTLARSVLCYGSESWTLKKSDERRITSSEMKFMRRTAGYTKYDHKKNEDILQELGIESILEYIHRYQGNWYQHVLRMSRTRIPRAILNYKPRGNRSQGRPLKRWLENFL